MIDADEAFSRQHDREVFYSAKWMRYAQRDVIPLWVADMDFPAPPAVIDALSSCAVHGIPGYTSAPPDMGGIVSRYCQRLYEWAVDPDWLVFLPGVVVGLNLACRVAGGGSVVVFSPVYPPFFSAPVNQGCELINVPLAQDGMYYAIDIDALVAAIRPDTRMILFCHPHNPVGRLWREDELSALARVVEEYDLLICSDEIHCDLLLDPGAVHRPFARLFPSLAARTITLMAPSKTYNIAGLGASFAVISDESLRRRFCRARGGLVPDLNAFAWPAMRAALTGCEQWRQALLGYLRENREDVARSLAAVGLPATRPEASFLTWIDARRLAEAYGNAQARCERFGIGLSDGKDFGAPGFLRLNFGCPRPLLGVALERLERCAI